MNNFRHRSTSLKTAIAAAIATSAVGFGAAVNAGELSFTGNSINVSANNGAFNQPGVAVGADGIVDTVNNLPNSGSLGFPTFSFNFEQNGVANGTYVFNAGISITDDNSQRKLDILIRNVTLTFSGNDSDTLEGTIGAGDLVASGRSADGSIRTHSNTLTNDLATFSGTTLFFDAAEQLAALQAGGGVLADITNTINTTSDYSYAVVLTQQSGDLIEFGLNAGPNFVSFKCVDAAQVFDIIDSPIAASLGDPDENYALQGKFNFDGTSVGTLTPFNETCAADAPVVTPPPAPEPEPEPEPSAEEQVNNAETAVNTIVVPTDEPVSQETVNQILDITEQSNNAADALVAELDAGEGTVNAEDALSIVRTLVSAVVVQGSAVTAGGTVAQSTVTTTINKLTNVLGALQRSGANAAQQTEVAAEVQRLFTNVIETVSDDVGVDDATSFTASATQVLRATRDLSGTNAISSDVVINARNLSNKVVQSSLRNIGAQKNQTINYESDEQTATLLENDNDLLERVLDVAAVEIPGEDLDLAGRAAQLEALGLEETDVPVPTYAVNLAFATPEESCETQLVDVVVPFETFNFDTLMFETVGTRNEQFISFACAPSISSINSNGSGLASDSSSAELANGLTSNEATGVVTFPSGDGEVSVIMTDQRLVPSSVPNGNFTLPNGGRVAINDGLSIRQQPSAREPLQFVAGVKNSGAGSFTTEITPIGTLRVTDVPTGAVFSGTFGFDGVDTSVAATGSMNFIGPAVGTLPRQATHFWQVEYADGTRQNIAPFLSGYQAFYRTLADFGFSVTTDRATGIINIDGAQFRPDFYVLPLSAEDEDFLAVNGDSNGTAFRSGDVNGDGVTDYEIITSFGSQLVYGR